MTMFAMAVATLGSSTDLPHDLVMIENGLTSAAVGLVALAAFKLSKILDGHLARLLALFSFNMTICYSWWPYLSPTLMIVGGLVFLVSDLICQRLNNYESLPTSDPQNSRHNASREVQPALNQINFDLHEKISLKQSSLVMFLFFGLLLASVYLREIQVENRYLNVLATFYFTGSIIFGGGPVVIPLLHAYVVSHTGWLSEKEFLLGLAIVNAMPG